MTFFLSNRLIQKYELVYVIVQIKGLLYSDDLYIYYAMCAAAREKGDDKDREIYEKRIKLRVVWSDKGNFLNILYVCLVQ